MWQGNSGAEGSISGCRRGPDSGWSDLADILETGQEILAKAENRKPDKSVRKNTFGD